MHVGGDGWLKTLDFVPRDSAHLADVLTGGERADGSSLFGDLGIPVGASDIVMRPRLSTAFVDPFAAEPTLAVLCSHFNRQGGPLAESPDTLVRAAYARLLAETGVELHALGEIEFFLGARVGDAEAYGANERGYHASRPVRVRRGAAPHGARAPRRDGRAGEVRPRGGRIRRGRRRRLARVGAARDRALAAPAARGRRRRRADAVGAAQPRAARRHAVQLRAHGAQGPRRQRHALPLRAPARRRVP